MRMPMELYDEVLTRITPAITKQDTWWRKALDPGLKFACTVRHIVSGDSYSTSGLALAPCACLSLEFAKQ